MLVFVSDLLSRADLQMSRLSSGGELNTLATRENARVGRDLARPPLRRSSRGGRHYLEAAVQKRALHNESVSENLRLVRVIDERFVAAR